MVFVRSSYGMTIMELLVCISIMCILACTAIPLSGVIQSNSLETAASELLSDLRLAQQRAKTNGAEVNVYLDVSSRCYSVYDYKNSCMVMYVKKQLPEGIRFDTLRSTFEKTGKLLFSSQGHPMPNPCTVTLCSRNGSYKSIVIGIATDYIYLKE